MRFSAVRIVFGLAIAAALCALWPARATTLGYGGDSLFVQVEKSALVVKARLTERASGRLVFEPERVLRGELSARQLAVESDPEMDHSEWKAGESYLLCLQRDPAGRLRPDSGRQSILHFTPAEMVHVERALLAFSGPRADPSELVRALIQVAASKSPFLQYSATFYLAQNGLAGVKQVDELVALVEEGTTVDARARQQVVTAAGRLRNAKYRRFFERRILDAREARWVRATALRALHGLDRTYAEALAPAVEKEGEPALMQTLKDLRRLPLPPRSSS
jgi:hypothetical protein